MNQPFILSSLVATLALVAMTAFGCSSNDAPTYSCSTKGPCPSDPIPSASQAAACESLAADPDCGDAFSAYSACAFSAAVCADGGLSDPDADATSAACNSEYATYTTCLGNKIDDAGTTH
jgi:hypothetical protein